MPTIRLYMLSMEALITDEDAMIWSCRQGYRPQSKHDSDDDEDDDVDERPFSWIIKTRVDQQEGGDSDSAASGSVNLLTKAYDQSSRNQGSLTASASKQLQTLS
ncbi:hypothetical protein Tco_1125590 [Tanacetum coccineum]|uniref:Uncharacterized protein n=1 Tax=Tanacetum coccineum TaxID=301880 RepID=A0ABQ5JAS5_9ASTR